MNAARELGAPGNLRLSIAYSKTDILHSVMVHFTLGADGFHMTEFTPEGGATMLLARAPATCIVSRLIMVTESITLT